MNVSSSRRLPLLLALLPTLAGACGVILYDTTSRELILEPVKRVVFASDGGAVEVYAFERTAISILYTLTGSDLDIEDVGAEVDGDDLRATIRCSGGDCNANYYCEIPLGTVVDIRADRGDVKLTGVDAPIKAIVGTGDVEGVKLTSPEIEIEVEAGTVSLDLAATDAIRTVRISVEEGGVELTLPAGNYRCELVAAGGEVIVHGVTCDPSATMTLSADVRTGDISLKAAQP